LAADPTFAHRSGDIRRRGIRTAAIIAGLVVVLRHVPLTSNLFLFSLIENYAYDLAHDYAVPSPPDDIVIIAIDDESMLPKHGLGRWPWPRSRHAELLRKLAGAHVVAFDVLFTEPDKSHDEQFAEAIREAANVVLAMYKRGKAEYSPGVGGVDWSYPRPEGPIALHGIQPVNFLQPVEKLAKAAAAIGYVDIDADADGVYRRVDPLRQGYDGKIYPHFATAIAQVASGIAPEQITSSIPQGYLQIGEVPAGLSADGSMLISYCGWTGTVPRFSYWQVLEGKVSPSEFEDKIVLVGATAEGLYDIRPAPYRTENRLFFGVETNANIVNTLLHLGPRYDRTTDLAWAVFALALGLLVGWTAWSGGEVIGPALAAGIVAIIAVPSFFVAFGRFDTVIPYGAVLLAAVVPLAVAIPERLGRDKRMVRQQFSVYVSPEVLRELGQDPELVAQGVRREVTLLFADVRGSTTLSENIPPETWVAQLNEYLTQMSEAIFNYDGYLDKFMGDGIMAIWNAFGNQPNHADLAAGAALQMLERLERLNQYWETREGRTPLRIGVAVHTGEAIIGNVGSEERMQYTAIGDTVNTASRIEGLTKQYGVMFIASETSARRLSEGIVELREIGATEVRGREEKVRIFTRASE
jgi:adenylate cyclase